MPRNTFEPIVQYLRLCHNEQLDKLGAYFLISLSAGRIFDSLMPCSK